MGRKTHKSIRFEFDRDKAVQAVLWLLRRNNGAMDKLKLIKLFFWADREHLVRYGRPIVGGEYYNLDYGPVSSELLNLVNESDADASSVPFSSDKRTHQVCANGLCEERLLSKSDLDVLDEVYNRYGHMDGFQLSDMTHKLTAYTQNEPPKGGRSALAYEDFFLDLADAKSQEMLRIILDEQEAWMDLA
ncbi:MAG: SocA family protein [Sedimentisphaerales bacterium]|nr:SocA family protein [Sedimentisphaerales bacterium]